MKIAVIDYGAGNLRSATKALEHVAPPSASVILADNGAALMDADAIVLPGVGAFGDCMQQLEQRPGLHDAMNKMVLERGVPFLGICVGMQLMAAMGHEFGHFKGLNWVDGDVVKLEPENPLFKVPHMGWNELDLVSNHPVLDGIESGSHMYFVHSYHFLPENPDCMIATVDYDGPVAAVIGRDNMVGVQFHPEKSQACGLKLLENFLKWRP